MPVFELELSDGRKFQVETDRPPTEQELPDLLKGLENPSGIQKMNPTGSNVLVDREAWMQTAQPGEGVTELGVTSGPITALEYGGAALLNQGQRFFQRANSIVPQHKFVDGKLVLSPALDPNQANQVATFETTGPSGQLAGERPPSFVPGQPIIQAKFANEDIDPINRAVGNALRGFSTPGSVATLGLGGMAAQVAPKLAQAGVMGVFGAPMLAQAPESTRAVGEAIGTYQGTPAEQRTPDLVEHIKETVANEVINKLMLAGLASHGAQLGIDAWKNRPLTPEVLPAEQPKPVGPSRQLAEPPPIDVESTGPAQLPQARRFYQSESKNPPVDASQLTQAELEARQSVYRPLPPQEPKGTYQAEPVIIGQNEPASIAKTLGLRYDGVQEWIPGQPKEVYTKPGETPYTVYVDKGTSLQDVANRLQEKEQQNVAGRAVKGGLVVPSLPSKPLGEIAGGKISFGAPAESGAIPSARQAGLPMAGEKGIAPQAPQMGQGEALKAGEAQDSGAELKAPINEAESSNSKNESNQIDLNTGPVTKKQQEWLVSSAKKLLNSPEKLKYAPNRQGEYDGGQLVNRLLNNVPPVEKEMLEKAGIKEQFKPGEKVSKDVVEKWIDDNGPQVKVETYGMEGKVSEARRQYNELTHSWSDNLSGARKDELIEAISRDGKLDVSQLEDMGWKQEDIDKAKEHNHLGALVRAEKLDGSNPRATSAYSIVSPFDTTQPMPEWTTSKSGKNVQRVDVVIPQKKLTGKDAVKSGGYSATLWQPDNLHENLPNTLGWAMIQYKTGPKGEKIAVVAEAQSRWGQEMRSLKEQALKDDQRPNSARHPDERGVDYTKKVKSIDHPLLRDYNRLILKAAIEQARKEGATHIVVSDSPTVMMSEALDQQHTFKGPYKDKADALDRMSKYMEKEGSWVQVGGLSEDWKPFQIGDKWYLSDKKGGYDFNYGPTFLDKNEKEQQATLPKIAEELTGNKGEKVSLGEHKNAWRNEPSYREDVEMYNAMQRGEVTKAEYERYRENKIRPNLIFKNANGTPKTDVSGMMYAIDKVAQAQEKSPFTITGSDKLKETKDEQGNVQYYHAGVPIPKEAIEAGKDVLKLAGKALNLYAEPIVEKLGRVGGPVAKKATEEFQQMISRQKQVYGELSPVVDAAKKATGKMGGGNTWLRKVNNITDKAGVNNMFASNEGAVAVPSEAVKTVQAIDKANLATGRAAKLANPDFDPTGKLQRILTNYGYDVIRRGNGPAWEAWTEGVAKANTMNVSDVRDFFGRWKEELDKPSSDVASMDRISQDFSRKFPSTVTHIKPGMAWHEVVTADPFNYIESAAQRTSHAVAFREVYPLVRDAKGKLGPSGYLQATRKAIQKELNTAGFDSNLFDNLVSVVQGHPLDTFTKGWNAPDSPLGAGYRMGQQLLGQPLKSLMLTANTISNAGEILAGGPSIFLGMHNVIPAMAELAKNNKLEKYLEFIGARNQAMYNMSFDPTSPARSAARIGSNVLRKATAQQLFNEIQETTSAMSAKFVADRIRNSDLSKYESDRISAVARVMGMTKKQADAMVAGDKDLLRQFETKAAAALTSGNQAMAEKSRLGTSRAFNELFWFQTYPQMKANQARKLFGNLFEDVNNKNWTSAYHNAALIGRFVGGTTMQGAITLMLMGLVTAGVYGLKQQGNEAKEETGKFMKDSLLSGMGGPLSILSRLAQNSGDAKSLTQGIVSLSPPVSAGQDLIDAGAGTGKYEGRTVGERIGMFLESKTPGMKTARTLLAISGLSQDDLQLRSAMKGFYSWRREQPDYKPATSGGGDEADVAVRTQMKRVKETIQRGGDWHKELEKVKDLVYAQHSLRSGTMLELNAKPLSKEQEASLTKRIGQEGVEKIKAYDTMLREIARNLGDVNKEKASLADVQPKGDKYIDQTTGTQRSEAVSEMLKPETVRFLEDNKKKIPTYVPEFGLTKKQLMDKEQAGVFEKILAEEVDKRLMSLMTNQVFLAKPLVKRQERISERLEFAKEIAETRFRATLRQRASQQ